MKEFPAVEEEVFEELAVLVPLTYSQFVRSNKKRR